MKQKIRLTEEASEFVKQFSMVVIDDKKYYNIPFYFREVEQGVFEIINIDNSSELANRHDQLVKRIRSAVPKKLQEYPMTYKEIAAKSL